MFQTCAHRCVSAEKGPPFQVSYLGLVVTGTAGTRLLLLLPRAFLLNSLDCFNPLICRLSIFASLLSTLPHPGFSISPWLQGRTVHLSTRFHFGRTALGNEQSSEMAVGGNPKSRPQCGRWQRRRLEGQNKCSPWGWGPELGKGCLGCGSCIWEATGRKAPQTEAQGVRVTESRLQAVCPGGDGEVQPDTAGRRLSAAHLVRPGRPVGCSLRQASGYHDSVVIRGGVWRVASGGSPPAGPAETSGEA